MRETIEKWLEDYKGKSIGVFENQAEMFQFDKAPSENYLVWIISPNGKSLIGWPYMDRMEEARKFAASL